MRQIVIVSIAMVLGSAAAAQSAATGPKPGQGARDSAFAAMQERGKTAMGVDQYTSVHKFVALADGGRIELQRSNGDSADVARIRAHMREIAGAFKKGDFGTPAFVHMQTVPGTKAMAAMAAVITYEARDLPRGAEVRIRSVDAAAVKAIHEFLAFQGKEHH